MRWMSPLIVTRSTPIAQPERQAERAQEEEPQAAVGATQPQLPQRQVGDEASSGRQQRSDQAASSMTSGDEHRERTTSALETIAQAHSQLASAASIALWMAVSERQCGAAARAP